MISDKVDRDALMRYLDLVQDISDLINKYEDLGIWPIVETLKSKAYETTAIATLPGKYHPPKD